MAIQQTRQLREVVRHAFETVPFYRQRFDALGLTPDTTVGQTAWQQVPLLTRRDIQTAGDRLYSIRTPEAHGQMKAAMTGGSTGQPVTVRNTGLTQLFWRALTLRDHHWHRRDFSLSLAAIRYTGDTEGRPPLGTQVDNWGSATQDVFPTGPAILLNVQSTIEEQANWLRQVDPGYILCYPSALLEIARLFEARGWSLPKLRELRTFGEILEPHCRSICERVFNTKVVDMYSSQEVGYIALQCPDRERYHIQSENVLVEILDESGRPCKPGQIGKVVITTVIRRFRTSHVSAFQNQPVNG